MPTTLPRRQRRNGWVPEPIVPLAFAAIPFIVLVVVVAIETRGRPTADDFVTVLDRAAIGIGDLEGSPMPLSPDRRGRTRFAAHAVFHRSDR